MSKKKSPTHRVEELYILRDILLERGGDILCDIHLIHPKDRRTLFMGSLPLQALTQTVTDQLEVAKAELAETSPSTLEKVLAAARGD